MPPPPLPRLARSAHAAHCKRCIAGLPVAQTDIDGSRLALAFYCIGSLDLLGVDILQRERDDWKQWIWEQQTTGQYGSGFRPSPFMTGRHPSEISVNYTEYDTPHIIMTYTALLSLAILRDDFSKLDRAGILTFLRACQREDGSFSTVPGSAESDLRTLYCAFAISSMLNDWSGVNVDRALSFIAKCRSYEGGYGQSPNCEAQGGTTYIAIASMALSPSSNNQLKQEQRSETIKWLLSNQADSGGFCGRTGKDADACYCFWCGAALKILGASELVDASALARFLATCQFKFGGISKAPGEHPDPYHTYLSLAALSMYPVTEEDGGDASWNLETLDPLLNAKEETARWARRHIPASRV
ncbi:terpenoid cyclases/protein prenyltransferase alpha-alpha toroid [Cyathus striatus]|nr:terpenoid cyclases/protein prenyltransferase alpha-alpha toroid [Cyathus striatus]